MPAVELLDAEPPAGAEPIGAEELERLRILAGTPRWGYELDDRVLPAEAGLEERAISFTKGCYPGQEPVARLHHRGHPNRTLRVLAVDGEGRPARRRADPRRQGRRARHERGARPTTASSRSPTSAARCPARRC